MVRRVTCRLSSVNGNVGVVTVVSVSVSVSMPVSNSAVSVSLAGLYFWGCGGFIRSTLEAHTALKQIANEQVLTS